MSRHVVAFVGSVSARGDRVLRAVRRRTLTTSMPVVQHRVRDFLRILLLVGGPVHILRIKATMNFSTLLVDSCLPRNKRVAAVRGCRGEVPVTERGFHETKGRSGVALVRKSTARMLTRVRKAFSFVFVSTTGKRCVRCLPGILQLLSSKNYLISSGIVRSKSVVRSHFTVRHEGHAVRTEVQRCLCRLGRERSLIASVVPLKSNITIDVGRKMRG